MSAVAFAITTSGNQSSAAIDPVSVQPPPTAPQVTTDSLVDAVATQAYSALIAATGPGTITFSATGLPPGLTMSGAGLLGGTPTIAGTYTLRITPTSSTVGAGTVAILTLVVQPAPAVVTPSVSGAWAAIIRGQSAFTQ